MATRLMGGLVFCGGLEECDPDSAADELRKAAYTVHRLPANHAILCHPLDDFIEVTIEAHDDEKIIATIEREVDGIAQR